MIGPAFAGLYFLVNEDAIIHLQLLHYVHF